MSSSKVRKRKGPETSAKHAPSKSSKVSLTTPSLLLLEIPADVNTALPVWDSVRSRQVDVAWTVTPYSINIRFTSLPSVAGDNPSPAQGDGASDVAQTARPQPLPPVLSQPQICIQPLPQRAGSVQNPTSVLLTFPESAPPPCPTHSVDPGLVKLSSLVLPLPLIIAQPQPAHRSGTAKGETAAGRQAQVTPPSWPLVPQAPPRRCGPFHTAVHPLAWICDRFLAGVCRVGKRCKLHHTPYPYHWQRCDADRTLPSASRWVDLPHGIQPLLERVYCDVDRDGITLQMSLEGGSRAGHTLDFEAMRLGGDLVRRLCNTTISAKSVYFPNEWHIFWWDCYYWKEYTEDVSKLLLKKMSEGALRCHFVINRQRYMVNLFSMTQTNITTGFQRNIRRRPAYRSLVKLHPNLRTGILSATFPAPTGPPTGHFNEDPLAEFRTWYPPVWAPNPEQNNGMVEVPVLSLAYQKIYSMFHQSMSETKVEILSIWQIHNILHWDKFQRYKDHMLKRGTKAEEPLEKHLFHGTLEANIQDICHNNFDHRMANNVSYGHGAYFARDASFSNDYAKRSEGDPVQHMFLAKVLVGKMSLGKMNYRRPPPVPKEDYNLYDTCVDKLPDPSIFVVFDRCQCYPYYLIKYRGLPTTIDVTI